MNLRKWLENATFTVILHTNTAAIVIDFTSFFDAHEVQIHCVSSDLER